MAPQFVDFNADGHIDIVTATFDGSPHVSFGSEKGFGAPEHILARDGSRIILEQYWDFDAEQWTDATSGFPDGVEPAGHAISAVAFDWDADGDHDLILGDKKKGMLFLRSNEGSASKPAFSMVNQRIEVGGEPFSLKSGLTAPEVVDWDSDGLMDLVVGSFGSPGSNESGGVWLLRNIGENGAPKFAPKVALIEPSAMEKGAAPMAPEEGLYVDAKDYDGDGILDLLVGGYSHWEAPRPDLTDEQKQRLVDLKATSVACDEKLRGMRMKAMEGDTDTVDERMKALTQTEEYKATVTELMNARKQIRAMEPGQKREGAVWLYRGQRG